MNGCSGKTYLTTGCSRQFRPVSPEFLSRLRAGWLEYLSKRLGLEIPEYMVSDDKLIERMRFIREIEIPTQSGLTATKTPATHEFGDVYRIIGPMAQNATSQSQFSAGDLVRCHEKTGSGGELVLEAFEKYVSPRTLSV